MTQRHKRPSLRNGLPMRDEHARSIVLARIDAAKPPAGVERVARELAGTHGRHAGVWATLDRFGAWCARRAEDSRRIDDAIVGRLSPDDRWLVRELLDLFEILRDGYAAGVYVALIVPCADALPGVPTGSLRHWPRAIRERYCDQLYQRGGYLRELDSDGREVPVLRGLRGGRR